MTRARHLSVRVPWHDNAWNGTVCDDPAANCHCVEYDNIAKHKSVSVEIGLKGQRWDRLADPKKIPPCANEAGGFMSPVEWTAFHTHPYRNWQTATHGHLLETSRTVPAYAAQVAPFWWLDRKNLEDVQDHVVEPLPQDSSPDDYHSNWIFQPHVQQAVLDGFFAPVIGGKSLAIFYTKTRQPVFDDVRRLVTGIGLVEKVRPTVTYESSDPSKPPHPLWEHDVVHTLRPHGRGGLLIPFHEYLAPTGDPAEDARRRDLAAELRIEPEPQHVRAFSYRTEHVTDDAAISVLTQALHVVDRIREHAIVAGDWADCETWINDRLGEAWKLRGGHPGLGAVLQASGLRMAASLVHLIDDTNTEFQRDPWRTVTKVLDGTVVPPHDRFRYDIDAFAREWLHLANDSRKMRLAKVLSSLDVTPDQAERWWTQSARLKHLGVQIRDEDIVANPYLVSENDRPSADSPRIGFAAVDRAVIGDGTANTAGRSVNDPQRIRAAVVEVLRAAEESGDTLLAHSDIVERAAELPVPTDVKIGPAWIPSNVDLLNGIVNVDGDGWAQLTRRARIANRLRQTLHRRSLKDAASVAEDWRPLLEASIRAKSPDFDVRRADDPGRIDRALDEQVEALQTIVSRRLTVLVGRAGTGKTTVLGALSRSGALGGPILFLAPTGKARVRLQRNIVSPSTVQTVAQYLFSQGAYDGSRQMPVIRDENTGTYDAHATVVIDESSMLTEETLLAVLATFSPNVQRVVLVGDTAQLPPIGPGRPFTDLVAHLSGDIVVADDDRDAPDKVARRQGAYARLQVEVRSSEGEDSDTLRFAKFFSGDPLPKNAEQVITDLQQGTDLNDLTVRYWTDGDALHDALTDVLAETPGIELKAGDTPRFNELFGISKGQYGWEVDDPDASETWQILSPVRGDRWGTLDLNRWVQETWRGTELAQARRNPKWSDPFGDNEIIRLDKVMLNRNLKDRTGWDHGGGGRIQEYLANGDIGLCANDSRTRQTAGKGSVMDIKFAGRSQQWQFGFKRFEFGGEGTGSMLDLAYALTVHKSQGSDFGTVIVVLPRHTRISSRELLYTALTRSRDRLILLVEGDDLSPVLALRDVEASDTAQRNTNLFRTSVRNHPDRPWAQHLIHRAADGTALRSKSELIIYRACKHAGLTPVYEQECRAADDPDVYKIPDFTFTTPDGDRIIWEHLGMLDTSRYAASWEQKRTWYLDQGFVEGETLFTTSEVGGFNDAAVDATIVAIKDQLEGDDW